MAEAAIQSPPSLSKDYLLPSEEKPIQPKPVEVTKEDVPVSVASEETASKKTEDAPVSLPSEVSSKAPVALAEDSSETPTGTTETTTDETVDANETSVEESTPVAEEGSDDSVSEETPEVKLETAPADFRFPTTNQTRHCFTRYIEYHRCVAAKGDDECDKFAKYYRSLCPGEWVDRWNEQRENGTFPGPL
ncbi:hypothetical protein RND81_02G096500 [Saponaria officinalis]|uniref:Cytochrome c oxidase subunit 6b-1 n=1 Tax=Saponaria officinalis TaxID=3572 RepID=A0AAW1MTL5_SAPOF